MYHDRPRGKESTDVRISQNKGKKSEKYENISTGTAVFLNQKRANVCEHTTKMALLCVHKHLLSSD